MHIAVIVDGPGRVKYIFVVNQHLHHLLYR